MADGILCVKCGWYESDHSEGVTGVCAHGDPKKVKRGYRLSLEKCGWNGFEGNKRDTERVGRAQEREEEYAGLVAEHRVNSYEGAGAMFIAKAIQGLRNNPFSRR